MQMLMKDRSALHTLIIALREPRHSPATILEYAICGRKGTGASGCILISPVPFIDNVTTSPFLVCVLSTQSWYSVACIYFPRLRSGSKDNQTPVPGEVSAMASSAALPTTGRAKARLSPFASRLPSV